MKRSLFIFLMILSTLILASQACTRQSNVPGVPVAQGTVTPVAKKISAFTQIKDTPYLIAAIQTSSNNDSWDFSLRSGSSYNYAVYNYVFFDTQTETYTTLLPANEFLVGDKIGLPILTDPEQKKPLVSWLYKIVKTDTNGDQQLNYLDQYTLAISDVSGKNYTELIPDIELDLGIFSPTDTIALVFYRANGKNYHAKIDLTTRAILSTQEMPAAGADVR